MEKSTLKKRSEHVDSKKFIEKCIKLVVDYTNNRIDATDDVVIDENEVFVVWQTKVLQNNKALLSTNLIDGMYYEITYNGDKQELYLDAYKKWENVAIKL